MVKTVVSLLILSIVLLFSRRGGAEDPPATEPANDPTITAQHQSQSRAIHRVMVRMRATANHSERQIQLGNQALALLQEHPAPVTEAEVRARMGEALLNEENYPEAMKHLEAGCVLSRKEKMDNMLLQCLGNISLITHLTGDTDQTLVSGLECLALAEKLDQETSVWRICSILGATYARLGNSRLALDHYSRALEIATNLEDGDGTSSLLNNISVIHMGIGEYDDALRYLLRAQKILEAQGDKHGIATGMTNRGQLYDLMGDPAKALECHRDALRLETEAGNRSGIAVAHHSLGNVFLTLGKYDEALDHFNDALGLQKSLGLQPEVIATLGSLARTYAALDRSAEALLSAQEGLDLAKGRSLKTHRADVLSALSKAQEATGDFKAALQSYREAARIDGEVRSLENRLEFSSFKARYDLREKEAEIDLLRKDNHLQDISADRDRVLRNSLLIGGLLLSVVALIGWNLFLAKRKAHQQLAAISGEVLAANRLTVARSTELELALEKIQRLEGLLPICAHCKSIRGDVGDWQPLEIYLSGHIDVHFSHTVCPSCLGSHYPELKKDPLPQDR